METNLGPKIAGISETLNYFWSNLSFKNNYFAILDILLVALIFYWVYLFLKETRAMRIIYGIFILAIIFLLARLLQLDTVNFILNYAITGIIVAIPIVFQPELRAGLEKLGRPEIMGEFGKLRRSKAYAVIEEIVKSSQLLAKNKTGALIVITRQTGLRDYIETGVKIDSEISTELIMTIFSQNTPLHDGAIIISGDKIIAASCTLPLADIQYDYTLGTRHRAAIGLTQQTDALAIVVSEEKGTISLASNGILSKNLSKEKLEDLLLKLLKTKPDKSVPQLKEEEKNKNV